jgi:EpsD family peptidyl-prolyl cis-trans isomerase
MMLDRIADMARISSKQLAVAISIAAGLTVAACGRDDGQRPASQVAAKVNEEEITVHQLNSAMAQFRILNGQQQGVTKQVLERMVDQELLVQKAIEKKLDRDPRIVQAMEASRRQILSQAYLEQLNGPIQKPSADEVKKFYDSRPELFADRKIYRLRELAINAGPELTAQALEAAIRKSKSLDDVVTWLKSQNVPFNASATVKAAEQLPLEVVPRLAQLQVGQIMLMPAQRGFLLMQVAAAEKQPLDEKRAQPFIEQYLMNQKKLETARTEIKQLRDAAKIEYLGVFAEVAASGAPEPAKPAAAPARSAPSAIDKGISGLR